MKPKLLLSLALFSSLSWATTPPAKWQTVSQGTATWLLMDIYHAKLKAASDLRPDFLHNEQPLLLELCYLKPIKAEIFIQGANKVLPKHLAPDLQTAVEQLHASYQAVQPQDCYHLSYEQGTTQLHLNQTTVFSTQTPGFKNLYFGIWLGEPPLSASLKAELLNFKPISASTP